MSIIPHLPRGVKGAVYFFHLGKLEIKMSIRQNPDCDSSFFDGYALQATVTLNTELASNIAAEGATMANVGRNKQLTYTILPNTEKEITISADGQNFEMNAMAFNGIRFFSLRQRRCSPPGS